MFKAVGSTVAALVLFAFVVRDRAWNDRASLTMTALLGLVAAWMWVRWARSRGGDPDDRGGDADDR
jgi:membrane protein implicated in regulation of membrane protease activity